MGARHKCEACVLVSTVITASEVSTLAVFLFLGRVVCLTSSTCIFARSGDNSTKERSKVVTVFVLGFNEGGLKAKEWDRLPSRVFFDSSD